MTTTFRLQRPDTEQYQVPLSFDDRMTTDFTKSQESNLLPSGEGSKDALGFLLDRKLNGIAYTPTGLAEYVASKVTAFFLRDQSFSTNDRRSCSVNRTLELQR
mgnify:CR=1 FL=1